VAGAPKEASGSYRVHSMSLPSLKSSETAARAPEGSKQPKATTIEASKAEEDGFIRTMVTQL